jgi:pseudouridine-5'-phosphate glycosidase
MIPMDFSPEVERARHEGRPLVALESTIITHGMPWPRNVETARRVEAEVRAHGAVPATMAVLDGRLRVGLAAAELEALSQARSVQKLSRADLGACLATGGTGATTVAATMICARLADIEVFATGGIGGVHRGAEQSFDISADLQELAQTPVTVVAAGAKAILDLPKTLELLETLGVPVIAVDQDELPAFWSGPRVSGPHFAWTSPRRSPPLTGCVAPWASPGASSSPTPFPKLTRSPPRSWPRTSPRRSVRPRKAASPPRPSPPFFCPASST